MNNTGFRLAISRRPYPERPKVTAAWIGSGGTVTEVDQFWTRPNLPARHTKIYGNSLFSLTLASAMGLELVTPSNRLLISLDFKWTKRFIRERCVSEISFNKGPLFVKPVKQKLFSARVYKCSIDLQRECCGLPVDTRVLISSPLSFRSETRAFILNGRVLDCATYRGRTSLTRARRFASEFARHNDLPFTCVIDVGEIGRGGWAVIELNPSWAACLNGCDAVRVLECIKTATQVKGNEP